MYSYPTLDSLMYKALLSPPRTRSERVLGRWVSSKRDVDFSVVYTEADVFGSKIRRWLTASNILFKEFPLELRCWPRPDTRSEWPELAAFALSIRPLERDRLLLTTVRVGAVFTKVMHCDGTFAARAASASTRSAVALVNSFKRHFKSGEAETWEASSSKSRGSILPLSRRLTKVGRMASEKTH